MAALLVDLDLQPVHPVVGLDDAVALLDVAGGKGLDRAGDLVLDDATHLQYTGAHGFEFRIELLGDMLVHVGVPMSSRG